MDKPLEFVQLLARFKLQVKRSLGERVDLEALARDSAYARQRLAEIEDAADDEELLILVQRVRDVVLPPPPQAAEPAGASRRYLTGARSW